MNIETGDDEDMEERVTTKVQIPRRLKLKLKALKVITGQTMSDTVTNALEEHIGEGDIREVVDGE